MTEFLKLVTGVFDPLTKFVDEVFTSDEERQAAKIKLEQIRKESIEKAIDFNSNLIDKQAAVLKNETSGNWLQRSWRPILMLCFGFIILYQYFLVHILRSIFGDSIPEFEIPGEFWTLLQIGIGGYVAARSIEKITPKIVEGNTKRKVAELEVENLNKKVEELKEQGLSGNDLVQAGRAQKKLERQQRRKLRRESRQRRREERLRERME